MKVYVIQSDSSDVYRNLAYENALLEYITALTEKGQQAIALFLWQNDKTVVIGKHQNPFKECNLDYMKSKGIKLARRTTGGGAVYHDKGNLNFTFVASYPLYDKHKNMQVILQALDSLGIKAELSGRNDILLNGRKFSGNAFKNGKSASLHHGTILINLAEETANNCLTPDDYKLAKKGVDSVKSRIINLKSIYENVDATVIAAALTESFTKAFAEKEKITTLPLITESLYEKYSSKAWLFGDYKTEDYTISGHFAWGSIGINFSLLDGKITDVKIATDSLESVLFDDMQVRLNGCLLADKALSAALFDYPDDIKQDVIKLLLSE